MLASSSGPIAPAAKLADTLKTDAEAPYIYFAGQRVHSMHERGFEVISSLSGWAEKDLMRMLKPTERSWQPTDLLPDSSSPDFFDQVCGFRLRQILPNS